MGELIKIDRSVGAGGMNLPLDVGKIGAALVAVGAENAGIIAVPLSLDALIQAIRVFQNVHQLAERNGKVERDGRTLIKINEILNDGMPPFPTPPEEQGAELTFLREMTSWVNGNVWAPVESSLTSEMKFKWTSVSGYGDIYYFALEEDVVPNWFGVLVPGYTESFDNIHIFFHPTPAQAGYQDVNYKSKAGWKGVFHYLTDKMAVQFCAAQTGQVLIMPLMTQGAAATCGIFPQRWEEIVGNMLGQIASENSWATFEPQSISSVVVSSFSSGITYSEAFRSRANLGDRLRGVIDFDGIISTYNAKSMALAAPAVRMWQMGATPETIPVLGVSNIFPMTHPRWREDGAPYKNSFKGRIPLQIHGTIPQTMMHFAARRAFFG